MLLGVEHFSSNLSQTTVVVEDAFRNVSWRCLLFFCLWLDSPLYFNTISLYFLPTRRNFFHYTSCSNPIDVLQSIYIFLFIAKSTRYIHIFYSQRTAKISVTLFLRSCRRVEMDWYHNPYGTVDFANAEINNDEIRCNSGIREHSFTLSYTTSKCCRGCFIRRWQSTDINLYRKGCCLRWKWKRKIKIRKSVIFIEYACTECVCCHQIKLKEKIRDFFSREFKRKKF